MFGVERDTDFMVKGYSRMRQIRENPLYGHESIYTKMSSGVWLELEAPTIMSMIAAGPDCIIHLPPPMTDEQREQLRAIWTLGGRWIAKDMPGDTFAFGYTPVKDMEWLSWIPSNDDKGENLFSIYRDFDVCNLVSWLDHEPYDIGKALGVGK